MNLIETTGGVRIHSFVLFDNVGPHDQHQYKLSIQLCELRCRALFAFLLGLPPNSKNIYMLLESMKTSSTLAM